MMAKTKREQNKKVRRKIVSPKVAHSKLVEEILIAAGSGDPAEYNAVLT